MLIFITERQICYKLNRLIWKCDKKSHSFKDWRRWNYGIEKEEFENHLFSKEFWGSGIKYTFICIYAKLRPKYLKTFIPKIKQTINHCVEAGYIEKKISNRGNFYTLTRKGKKIISSLYFLKKIFSFINFNKDLIF